MLTVYQMCGGVVVVVVLRPVVGWMRYINCKWKRWCDWSGTLSSRLVDRFSTLWVKSSGRVAGRGEVQQNLVRRCLSLWL